MAYLAGMADQTSSFTLKPPGRAIQYVVASIAAYPFGEPGASARFTQGLSRQRARSSTSSS
jgi:hypothetical protein